MAKKPIVVDKPPAIGDVPVWRKPGGGEGKWVPEEMTAGGGGGPTDWGDIGGTLSDQTDLQAELDGKEDVGVAAALAAGKENVGVAAGLVAAHAAAGDPHTVYLTEAEADALYDPLGEAAAEVAAHEALPDPHPQYISSQSNQAVSAANGSFAFQTLSFSNANGISFGTSAGSAITASVLPQSAQTLGLYASSNTTGQSSSSTFDARSLSFVGHGIASVGFSNGSVNISVPAGGGGGDGVNILAAGTQTANTTGTILFSNSNGISFGMSGSTQITASYTRPVASNAIQSVGSATGSGTNTSRFAADDHVHAGVFSMGVSNVGNTAGDTRVDVGRFVLAGGNNITLSQGTAANALNTITISAAAQTVQTQSNVQGIIVSNTTYRTGDVSFSNLNGISFGSNGANVVTASYTVPVVTNSSMSISDAATSGTLARLAFTNSNGVTLSLSTGAAGLHTIVGSHNGLTSQSNQAFSAGAASSAFQTLSFQDSNGVSFSNNAGAIRITHALAGTATAITGLASMTVNSGGISFNGSNLAGTGTTFNGANVSGSMTINSAGVQLSLSAGAGGGGVNPAASASNGSFAFTTLNFSNANNVTFGTSAGGIITASVAAPGAAAEANAINLLGANTAGNTTATGSTIGWSGVNLTLSGTNASQVIISAPATSSLVGVSGVGVSTNGSTISLYDNVTLRGYLEPLLDREMINGQIGNSTLFIQPLRLRNNVQFDEIAQLNVYTAASNSSGSATLSLSVGFYTRTASSLSLVTSASQSYAVTNSGTVGSYSIYGGAREFAIPLTTTFTKGDYFIAFISRTTTGGAAGMTWSNMVGSNANSAYSGRWSSANNATNQWAMGMGSYSVGTTAFPDSIAFSQINGSGANNMRQIIFQLVSADLN